MKFWKLSDSKTNKLIFIYKNCIYKGNPKPEVLSKLNVESTNFSFLDTLFGIPYAYIKRIENQQGKNEIKIYFGNGSKEELIIKNKTIKNEVFNYLKHDLTNFKYSYRLPSILQYAKAQFFALLFITVLFIPSLYLAVQIEKGYEYEIIGGGRGIFSIVLLLANFGVVKNIIGYITLLCITIFAILNKLKSRSKIEFLKR